MSIWNEYQARRLKELEAENKAQRALIEMYENLLNELQFPLSMLYKLKEIQDARDGLFLEDK
jgi:hypothetical protein